VQQRERQRISPAKQCQSVTLQKAQRHLDPTCRVGNRGEDACGELKCTVCCNSLIVMCKSRVV
jgi:hypothetical protein